MEPPEQLVDAVLEGRCVAFVGAGFSAAVVPTWTRLLERVAGGDGIAESARAEVLELITSGGPLSLEAAAQLLLGELGNDRFSEALAGLLESPVISDVQARRLELLQGIPFRGILTTNFDGLLPGFLPSPKAYRRILRPSGAGWYQDRYWHRGGGPAVVKLHGDVRRPKSVVITRRDYRERLYTNSAYASFLRAVFSTSTLLFMGCSFSDPYLNELRSEVLAMFGQRDQDEPLAYAVVNDAAAARVAFFREHEGMHVLSYDTRADPEHRAFDGFLEALYKRTNPVLFLGSLLAKKRVVWLDPNPKATGHGFELLRRAAHLAEAGFELEEVSDVEGAVHSLAARPADLVITHWGHSPGGSNCERLLGEMRRRDLRAPVIVFASGHYADDNKRAALRAGAIAYCYRWATLFRKLRDIFDHGERTG